MTEIPESLKKILSLSPQERSKIKVVMTGGVFDLIHIGHIYTLSEAKKQGNFLVVVVARDDLITKKGRKPIHPQEYRAKMVEALKPVDAVILGDNDPMKLVELIKPDIIVYGYDQPIFMKPEGVKIVKLEKALNENDMKTTKILEKFGF